MTGIAANPERPVSEQVELVARRFHEKHEQLFHRQKRDEPVRPWDEMPESYCRRVRGTFDALIRGGVVAPGPVIGWEHKDPNE